MMQDGMVVRVTEGGRGFVIADQHRQYVITAAHCLPYLPPPHAASYTEERTFPNLLGPLTSSCCSVSAECAFVDPVSDLAVLQEPDGQEVCDEHSAYEALTEKAVPFPLGRLRLRRPWHRQPNGRVLRGWPEASANALMLSLEGEWFSCRIRSRARMLWVEDATQDIRGGMSGSPIILPNGSAIGVVCIRRHSNIASHGGPDPTGARQGGPNPVLVGCLPAWLVNDHSPVGRTSG